MKRTNLMGVIAGSNFVVIENTLKRMTLADGRRDWVRRTVFEVKHKSGRLIQSKWEGFATMEGAIKNLIRQFDEVSAEEDDRV